MSDDLTNAEIGRALVRIEASIAEVKAELVRVTDDHEKRLRAVERWMWTAMGASLVGAGSGLWAAFGGG